MRIPLQVFIILHAFSGVASFLTTSLALPGRRQSEYSAAADQPGARQHCLESTRRCCSVSVPKGLKPGLNNHAKICDIPVDAVSRGWCDGWEKADVRKWKSINRGTDLFLRGMGGFNIQKAYDTIIAHRLQEGREYIHVLKNLCDHEVEELCESLGIAENPLSNWEAHVSRTRQFRADVAQLALTVIREGTSSSSFSKLILLQSDDNSPYWFVKVSLMQAWGYFGCSLEKMTFREAYEAGADLAYLLRLPEDCPQRQHLIRYNHSWSKQEKLASLDELITTSVTGFWPVGGDHMKPPTLLNALREYQREKQLVERGGGDVTYNHLSDLEDSGSLRVLRSSREIMDVGIAMNNCALSYAKDVEREECILIAKYDLVKKNKPIALGMIRRDDKRGLAQEWSQIYLSCNRAPPDEVKQEYHKYETVLRAWFTKMYPDLE